jgi:hypothetical protein
MVSKQTHLTFETERPTLDQQHPSSSSSATPRRPPHLQPILPSHQLQTPPQPILLPSSTTSPTTPAPVFHTTPINRSRTHILPDDPTFLTSVSRPLFRNPFDLSANSTAGEGEQDISLDSALSPTPAPQFAEQLLTPLRRRQTRAQQLAFTNDEHEGGFYDESEGDLYRGPGPSVGSVMTQAGESSTRMLSPSGRSPRAGAQLQARQTLQSCQDQGGE